MFSKTHLNVLLLLLLLSPVAFAGFPIDNTCKTCPRRQLDSLNVYKVRPVRVNQAGYRPQDKRKFAFVGNPLTTTFAVFSATTNQQVSTGTLQSLGKAPAGKMWVNGAFNSINTIYNFGDKDTAVKVEENLYKADFSSLSTQGRYYVVCGKDTSATFWIHDELYNQVFETLLKFYGSNRCGNTDSWIHKPCHVKDGSALGATFEGRLAGGWHDCGDHGKYSETEGYAALVLAFTYAVFPEKAEDFYGRSYDDSLPDGIPDLLYEAKIGADFIFNLYKVSKERGLVAMNDMYHSVGTGPGSDHLFWDVPEKQESQGPNKGGPPRPVTANIGCNVAGTYAATLALFSWGWRPFDPAYADSCAKAAIDIYDNIVMKNLTKNTTMPCCYTGAGPLWDDPALAALSLWYITKDKRFGYDLYQNTALYSEPLLSQYNMDQFAAGFLAHKPFHHGGWITDYQNVHSFVLYGMPKLILRDYATASQYGLSAAVRDTLLKKSIACLHSSIRDGTNGSDHTTFPGINVDQPYHGAWTSGDWGFNRYNMGSVMELFMYWDLTGTEDYFNIGLDNFNYNLGINPWDMSFIMSAGDRNLQHPHNRAANPDGYNAGGFPYKYTSPKGALMGGCKPGKTLWDDWSDFTVTETCIDFSAQMILPALMLSKDLPPDNTGPEFYDITVIQISDSAVIITWRTNELSRDTLSYGRQPAVPVTKAGSGGLSQSKAITLDQLTPNATYYFYLQGTDIRNNTSRDDNHGNWYTFTLTKATNPQTSNVRVCNVGSNVATVYWWTNVPSTSQVNYGTSTAIGLSVRGDDNGVAGRFHAVTLRNLKPNTKYYFDVVSGTTVDNNAGAHYQFTTHTEFFNLNITVKPTNRQNNGVGAHFYILVTNNDVAPFYGLTLRFYFQMDSAQAAQMVAQSNDNQMFLGDGTVRGATIATGKPQQTTVNGTKYWYIPIVINDTLGVSSMARIELKPCGGSSGWDPMPFSAFTNAWSIVPHTTPVIGPGIDLSKGLVYKTPDFVETVNGKPELTYVDDPYIPAYLQNTHIYGYGPDYATDMPKMPVTVKMTFSRPVQTPVNSYNTDSASVNFAGTAWAYPNARISDVELNAGAITFTQVNSRPDSVVFTHTTNPLAIGANVHEFVAWHDKTGDDCACAYKRITVNFDTVRIPPVRRFIKLIPGDSIRDYQGNRNLVSITLTDTAGNVVTGEDILLSIASSHARLQVFTDANSSIPITSVALVNGRATISVAGDTALTGTITVSPSATREGTVYAPASLRIIIIARPPWPYIVSARMVDPAGNMVPGRVDAILSDTFSATQSLTSAQVIYAGTTYTIPAASITLAGTSLQLELPAGLPPDPTPSGTLTLLINVVGEAKSQSGPITDGIGPQIKNAVLLENANPAKTMVLVAFSELVQPQFIRGETILGILAGQTDTLTFTVDSFYVRGGNSVFALHAAKGAVTLSVSDRIRLMPGSAGIKDMAGNTPHQANPFVVITAGPTPAKRAVYFDGNADGYVDSVILYFSRAVSTSGMVISLDWSDIKTDTLGSKYLGYYQGDSSKVTVRIDSAFTKRVLRTTNPMAASLQYRLFPEGSQSFLVQDSAAPVLLEAVFCPGGPVPGTATSAPDTMNVRFSEASQLFGQTAPLRFINPATGNPYSISLSFLSENRTDFTMRFLVTSVPGSFTVTEGDSVWMAPGAFGDLNDPSVVQQNQNNRRVALHVKPAGAQILIRLSQNPFAPGKAGGPLKIDVSYQSTVSFASSLQASAKIYDAIGNCVYSIDRFTQRPPNAVFGTWTGVNRNNREVGTGTYLGVIHIQDGKDVNMVKKVLIGVKR